MDYTGQILEIVNGTENALINILVVDQLLKDIISYLIEQNQIGTITPVKQIVL